MIPSIIHIQYSKNRSVFTSEERLKQTIRQVESIKKYCDDAFIVVLEMSNLSTEEMMRLAGCADWVVPFHQDPTLIQYAHHEPNKNIAEVYVMQEFLKSCDIPFDHYAKFGGRYWFDRPITDILFRDIPVMKVVFASCYNQHVVEPVFYSIPESQMGIFKAEFLEVGIIRMQYEYTDNEKLLYDLYASQYIVHNPKKMYIKGFTAGEGAFRFY